MDGSLAKVNSLKMSPTLQTALVGAVTEAKVELSTIENMVWLLKQRLAEIEGVVNAQWNRTSRLADTSSVPPEEESSEQT